MKALMTLLILSVFLLPRHMAGAQENEEVPMVRYSPYYVFKDGIYLSIHDVKANDPIPFSRIVTDSYVHDKDFFNELISRKAIVFHDEAGVRASINAGDIWGYALNGRLHMMVGGSFQRIMLQGTISQFIASETTNERVYYDDEDTLTRYTTTQDLYRGFYRDSYYYRTLTAEGEVCLYDFESNSLNPYEPESLGKLLERDSVLFSEYQPLRKREKRKRMAEFIRRYNQRYPLYFPAE